MGGMSSPSSWDARNGIDAGRIESWLCERFPRAEPPLEFQRIEGGRSNLTYRLTDRAERSWALRRPPLGERLASAHDMAREHRIISALQQSVVPVPGNPVFCGDERVTGAPFYVTDFVPGPVLRSRDGASQQFDCETQREIGGHLVDALVSIHAVDPDAVGLSDLGKKEGYVERQLKRWSGQWAKSRTRDLPMIDELHERLSQRVPIQGPSSLVHGDYRLENVILARSGEVAAVLDWELCTLGDPLADLGTLLVYWGDPADDAKPLGDPPTMAPGFLTRAEAKERYSRHSGRSLADIDFYIALGYWKIAVILEGVVARQLLGQQGHISRAEAVDPAVVPALAAQASNALD